MADLDKIREEAVRGPWLAVLADRYGFVYSSVEDARESAEDGEVTISVVRGTAAEMRDGGCRERLPGTYHSCDKAYGVDAYIDDPDDESIGAEARWAQARAMAAGLNRAGAEPVAVEGREP